MINPEVETSSLLIIGDVNTPEPVCIRGPLKNAIEATMMRKQEIFACGVQTTSRPPRINEIPGHDFHFISEDEMLDDIRNKKFIEYYTKDNYLYGLSIDSVKECLNKYTSVHFIDPFANSLIRSSQGRQCVLNTTFDRSLRTLKSLTDIQPIVIYVASAEEQIRTWAPNGNLHEYFIRILFHNGEIDRRDYADLITHEILDGSSLDDVIQKAIDICTQSRQRKMREIAIV